MAVNGKTLQCCLLLCLKRTSSFAHVECEGKYGLNLCISRVYGPRHVYLRTRGRRVKETNDFVYRGNMTLP